jgi:hypothetical protein
MMRPRPSGPRLIDAVTTVSAMSRVTHLVTAAHAALNGERLRLDTTARPDFVAVMFWLVLTMAALFLFSAVLDGPPDNG